MNIIRVGIAIPVMESLPVNTAISLTQMVVESRMRNIKPRLITGKSALVEVSRHNMVENCLANNMDYVLFIDSDMTFPPDTIVKLIERNVDIVCCDASTKSDNGRTVCKDLKGIELDHKSGLTGLVSIAAAGTGIMLVKIDVFKKMERPWFLVEYDKGSNLYVGEDYYFSSKAKILGYDIFCDLTLSQDIGHTGHKTFYINKEIEKERNIK